MLKALKTAIKGFIPPVLYVAGILVCLVTIFKKVEIGLFLLVAMIPQPNIWYKLHEYPMGNNFVDFLFFSIVLGMILQGKGFTKTSNSTLIVLFIAVSYAALWNSSMRFFLPLPISTDSALLLEWKNYAQMIVLYFLILNVIKTEQQQKWLVTMMSAVVLLIAVRSFRSFSGGSGFRYDKRVGGPFEAVGLGPNHFGAFIVIVGAVLLGLLILDREFRRRALYAAALLFSLHPLFFAYSRGAYAAALGVMTFFGVMKQRSLLVVLAVIFMTWQTVLPVSVVDRILMTETEEGTLEGSAARRLDLWDHAMGLFEEHPVFGIGFGGFGFTVPEGQLTDTHNFYMKTLAEQGLIGFALLALLLLKALHSGWRLYRAGRSPFHQGLGFGFIGAVIACMITNLFGDRWSYFALGGYFWIFWGLVDRGLLLSQQPIEPKKIEQTA